MSFTIKGVEGATQSSSQPSPAQQSARERAISRLMGETPQSSIPQQSQGIQQAQETAVKNPNAVLAEEMSAISNTSEEEKEEAGQNHEGEGETSEEQPVEMKQEKKVEEEEKKDEEPLSNQYALLARREKAIRAKALQQQQELKAKEAEIQAERDALKAKEAEYQSKYIDKAKLAEDPLSVLSELGLSYDQLTQLALNAPKPEDIERANEIKALKAEIQELRSEQDKTKKVYEDAQTQAYQQAISQIKAEATSLVKDNPDFEAISATNSVDDVVELIEEVFNKDGVLLTVEEAATEVESYLVEEAARLARLNKIQQKLNQAKAPASKPAVEAKKPQAESEKPLMKTLTNSVGISRPLSARDRAILAFKGEKA